MYHYTECGLQNVWLRNGYTKHKTPYGAGVAFADLAGLHAAIGRAVAQRPRLTGAELRFLRKEMNLSQAALAHLIGCTEQNASLWERKGKMPKTADRMVRLLYREHVDKNVKVLKLIESVIDLDDAPEQKMVLEQVDGHWPKAA